MSDDPLETVYSYVERAYVRLQAGDLLTRCMEDVSVQPLQQLVEGLVLSGPNSLNALREILAEAERRKAQVRDDLHQLMQQLESSLHSYGMRLHGEKDSLRYLRLTTPALRKLLSEQQITDKSIRSACIQLLRDSRDLVDTLNARMDLLAEIESYLQDWLWATAYQSAHTDSPNLGQ